MVFENRRSGAVDEMNFQYPVSFISFAYPAADAVVVIRVYVEG